MAHKFFLCVSALLLAGCKAQQPGVQASTLAQSDPPVVDAGISIERAYEAIPHRRTVWSPEASSVPAAEKTYLRTMFQVLDEGVAVRVAGQQNYASGHMEYMDPVEQYGQLLTLARSMKVPPTLASYHQHILTALEGQQQYFADWRAQGDQFQFAQQIGNHPGVLKASAHLRAAYAELTAKYPNEAAANKDAFFDYHCALDFM